jgi:glycosyltransferase involved in cell wall biosynthesis
VYVGRLKRYKRLPLLVQAVERLRAVLPEVHLDIAGAGDARAELESLVEARGLQECVTVHGFVDDRQKAALIEAAVVFASPSMHEGWGLSVVEANALGRPAVAYDVPGLRQAIRHGETGLIAADDRALERALLAILTDDVLWERLSLGARRWAARFDWDVTAAATLSVLDAAAVHRLPVAATVKEQVT